MKAKNSEGARVIAVDLSESRRNKALHIVNTLGGVPNGGVFKVGSAEEAKKIVADWTKGLGCNAALEVSPSVSLVGHVLTMFRLWVTMTL